MAANCDLYAAVNEDGINLVARHVMQQRPSWFNYATQYVSDHPQLACKPVAHTIDVTNYHNPLFTVVGPIPILGADSPPVGLNFCVQLVEAQVDFYPGNIVNLPAALNPPLAQQHLAMHVKICGGWIAQLNFSKGLPMPYRKRISRAACVGTRRWHRKAKHPERQDRHIYR